MNDLNSVLIEGKITEAPHTTADNRCMFFMLSVRREDDVINGGTKRIESLIRVEVKLNRLAQACIENLPIGRGLRIIGRLEGETFTASDGPEHTELRVIAEHVESSL